jgi:hypothetical protein
MNDKNLMLFCSAILLAPVNAFYMFIYTKDQHCCNFGPVVPAVTTRAGKGPFRGVMVHIIVFI